MSGQADGRGGRMSAIDLTRLARSVHLDVRQVGVDRYLVSGGRDDHFVEIVDGRAYCDCPDAQVRGPDCKHCLLVRLLGGDPEVALALRQLVPQPARRTRVTA